MFPRATGGMVDSQLESRGKDSIVNITFKVDKHVICLISLTEGLSLEKRDRTE